MNRSFLFKAASVATFASVAMAGTANAQGAGGFANFFNVVGQAQISSPGAGNGFPLFIDFLSGAAYPPGTVGNGQPGNVFAGSQNSAKGLFASIPAGASGVIQDLVVSANGTSTTTNPSTAPFFMQIGGYTFTLTSAPPGSTFGPITLRDTQGGSEADFSIFGNVTGAGFGPATIYQGLFTAQFAGQTSAQVLNAINNGGSPIVTFSANFGAPVNAAVVPEPSTYALLATGLGALGVAVRRRRANV
jgi:hypothetical protein